MKLPEWLLQDGDNLPLLLHEVKLLLNKYHCNETPCFFICNNCREYGLSSLKRLVTRSLKQGTVLEVNLGISDDVGYEEPVNLRVRWLEQLKAKLLLELKGN